MSTLASWWFNSEDTGDDMAENYKEFAEYRANSSSSTTLRIGWNRTDTLIDLDNGTTMDDTVLQSLHLADDTTDYQNTTGADVYVVVTMNAFIDSGDRRFKIWSAPTTDSKTAATQVFDSNEMKDFTNWDATGDRLTSRLVPISDNHYIVVENASGSASRRISFLDALVVEPAV